MKQALVLLALTLLPLTESTTIFPRQALPTKTPLRISTRSLPASIPVTALEQCRSIEAPGNYQLTQDLAAGGDCINIETSNVDLDCAEHRIQGTRYDGAGIAIRKYGIFNSQTPSNIGVHNCIVSGFHYGIFAESGTQLTIRHNDTSHNFDDADPVTRWGIFLGVVEGGGIRLNNVRDSEISDNISNRQAIGINVQFANNVLVQNNTTSENSAWGIHFWNTQKSRIIGNAATDNIRQCTWGSGVTGWGCDAAGIILQMGSGNNLIASNLVSGRNGNGIFLKAHNQPCGDNNQIEGNTIEGDFYNGIELSFCSGNNIIHNQIHGGYDGIWLGFSKDLEIRDNEFENLSNHGIVSPNSQRISVIGNSFVNINEGVFFLSWDDAQISFPWLSPGDHSSRSNSFCDNTFQSNAVAIHLKDTTSTHLSGNTFRESGLNLLVEQQQSGKYLRRELVDAPDLPDDLDKGGKGD